MIYRNKFSSNNSISDTVVALKRLPMKFLMQRFMLMATPRKIKFFTKVYGSDSITAINDDSVILMIKIVFTNLVCRIKIFFHFCIINGEKRTELIVDLTKFQHSFLPIY